MMTVFTREEMDGFRSIVAERLGLDYDDAKFDHLAEVLRDRLRATGDVQFSAYLERLTSAATCHTELRALAQHLTVGETYFFRHPDHFRAFVEVALPARWQAPAGSRQVRILSAGCASGEEPYTLAMLIRDSLPELAAGTVTILGIDVNALLLDKARRARYAAWSLRNTSESVRQRAFHPEGKEFLLQEAIRAMVSFEERNLIEDDPGFWRPAVFDIIFCRNVTMYFGPAATRAVMARMAHALAPGGFLFLGPAETLRGISQAFHLRHTHGTFYYQRRDPTETLARSDVAPQARPAPWPAPPIAAALEPDTSWIGIICRASERIATLAHDAVSQTSPASLAAAPTDQMATPARPAYADLDLARECVRQERFEDAMEILQALPPASAADPDVQLLRALLLTNRGEVAEAERVCQQVLACDELNAGAHYLKALCREHAGDRLAAVAQDQMAIYLDPMFAMPHLHLGLLAKRAGDTETARRELGQAGTLLAREDAARILLFGGGFSREALMQLCRAELRAGGGAR